MPSKHFNRTSFGQDSRPYSAREDRLILAMEYGDAPALAAQLERTTKSILNRKSKLKNKPILVIDEISVLSEKFDAIIAGKKIKRVYSPFARPSFFNEDIKTLSRVSSNSRILNGAKDRAHAALSFKA